MFTNSNTRTTSTSLASSLVARRVALAHLQEWDIEDDSFYEYEGKEIGARNLWASIPNLLLGFAVSERWVASVASDGWARVLLAASLGPNRPPSPLRAESTPAGRAASRLPRSRSFRAPASTTARRSVAFSQATCSRAPSWPLTSSTLGRIMRAG
jgi:hypothetical protein